MKQISPFQPARQDDNHRAAGPNEVTYRHASSILIVDDAPANLQVLAGMLKERGYQVRAALSGKLALQAAQIDSPDLILLDINMPEMNGYEVCKVLKADEKLNEVPVIFISALDETIDKVRAFGVGGVDYVTKPFQFEEVEARIRAHLEIGRQRRELQQNNAQLRELEQLRDSLVHMIVHDLRSPLTVIRSSLQLIEITDGKTLTPSGVRSVHRALDSTDTLIDMIGTLLDVSKIEAGAMQLNLARCNLVESARQVLGSMEVLRRQRELSLEEPGRPIEALADPDLIQRVFENLVGNALKFAPANGWIRVGIAPAPSERVRVTVEDNGPGVPPEYQEKIFEKFGQAESSLNHGQRNSTGLGLTFCKLVVEAHGGHIGVMSNVGEGSTFWFELPVNGPPPDPAVVEPI
ncbi:MAG TPA: hybrid sensor histidine kinase/response regulator [Aggregatilineales bacterium]|nr:hybrid sensor histidine kinase/response regulator [Aggregatilineales bacterium]